MPTLSPEACRLVRSIKARAWPASSCLLLPPSRFPLLTPSSMEMAKLKWNHNVPWPTPPQGLGACFGTA